MSAPSAQLVASDISTTVASISSDEGSTASERTHEQQPSTPPPKSKTERVFSGVKVRLPDEECPEPGNDLPQCQPVQPGRLTWGGSPLLDEEQQPQVRDATPVVQDPPPPVRLLFFSMLCIFQGYAVMVGPCQQKFKAALHVGQFGFEAEMFTQAAAFVHWGKFFARIGHNVVFSCLSLRQRVLVAMGFVFVGCLIPPLFVFSLGYDWIGSVFLSYGFSGIGIGVFECTFLAAITPLGGATKSLVIMAVPIGFGMINVFGMICTSVGVPVEIIYWYVVGCIPLGMAIFQVYAPCEKNSLTGDHSQATFLQSLRDGRSWIVSAIPFLFAKVFVNFAMEDITPVSFYTFNAKYVPMFSPGATTSLMNHDIFFAILALVTAIGNTGSLHVAHKMHLRRYASFVSVMAWSCVLAFVCCWMVTLKIALVSIIAVFLAFWANGTVYGGSVDYFDKFVPRQHNLAAYSIWCCVGDLGPIFGGMMMDVLRGFVCGGQVYPYTCRTNN